MSELKKLHLGCGDIYIPGYVNIDYPSNEHSVHQDLKADLYTDLKTLQYETESITEIRLHHVFEHFDRATSIQLLIAWYGWLGDNGILIIETPDFLRNIRNCLFGGEKKRAKILRHIFGSHEADWAVHYDGWYKAKYELFLQKLGYKDLKFEYNHWNNLHNITVRAQKYRPFKTLKEQATAAQELLKLSLVDDSPVEQRIFQAWLNNMNIEQ